VDDPGHDLLAHARRPGDEDARAGQRDLLDGAAHLLDGGGPADQLALVADLQLELGVLALEAGRLSRTLDQDQQPVGVERLLEKVVGALLDRRHGRLDGAVAADDQHRQVGVALPDEVEHLETVEVGALEPDVQEHEARRARLDLGQRGATVARLADLIALVVEDRRDRVAHLVLVVDDQNLGSHFISGR
jgi:hypothetical protein